MTDEDHGGQFEQWDEPITTPPEPLRQEEIDHFRQWCYQRGERRRVDTLLATIDAMQRENTRLRRGARCEDALVQIINVAHHTCSATAIAKATLDEDVRKETT